MFADLFLPNSLPHPPNPILRYAWRRLRFFRSPQRLSRYNRLILFGIPILVALWWLIEKASFGFRQIPSFLGLEELRLILLLIASGGAMLLSSLYTVFAAIGSTNREVNSDQWELVRLTNLSQQQLLDALDGVARLRSWPLVMVESGLRLSILVVATLEIIYMLLVDIDTGYLFINPFCFAVYLFVLVFFAAFILEPIFRARTLVAFCIAVAMYIRALPFALLVGFVGIVLAHAIQIFFFGGAIWLITLSTRGSAGIIGAMGFTFLGLGILYFAYVRLRRAARAFTLQHAFR